jgi:REP element-mobilizing transposase RayT
MHDRAQPATPKASFDGLDDHDRRQIGSVLLTALLILRTHRRTSPMETTAMTIARSRLIDPTVTRWYHCVTRCVRRAFLLDDEKHHRKEWLENRLKELADCFAVAVGGFSVMNNHLHVLVRLDPEISAAWSDEEVVRRWGRLCPPRDKSRRPLPVSEEWIQCRLKDVPWVATTRERLKSLSWFMKYLKEPLARLANRQDKARGAFFESRFKSVAILDEEALLATCVYIYLNPIAAKIADTPETSDHTSIKQRLAHVEAQGQTAQLEAARDGSVAGSLAAAGLEESLWLCPIEDRRELDSSREGMMDGISLGSYARLVDYTGRLFRPGKAMISAGLAEIFQRLGSNAESWRFRMDKLRKSQLPGRFFAASQAKLQQVAEHFEVRSVVNLARCPVR